MLKVLHLFDRYLPHSMNWAYQIMQATPNTEKWIAAPWMVDNEYFIPDFKSFKRPLQQLPGFFPTTEWGLRGLADFLIRAETRLPLYRYFVQQKMRKQAPDLLHAHFAPIAYHYLPLARSLKRPLVVSFYGYDYASLPYLKPVWKDRYRRLFEQATAITCAGPAGREILLEHGAPADKLFISPMSLQTKDFPFRKRYKSPGQLRLVQVATITEKKGFPDTITAFAKALRVCPNMELTIAGEPYDRVLTEQIKAMIDQYQIAKQVRFLPFIQHPALAGFLQDFDVFIHPSHFTNHRDCEGGPVAILEAQALGLPVISTTHVDIPQEVLHGKTGLLSPEKDTEQLAASIERFYHMEDVEYQRFSSAAQAHVRTHFEVTQTASRLYALYQKIQ
jgi:colanic acid/amylovoran biosynthesis glycosyltransferase